MNWKIWRHRKPPSDATIRAHRLAEESQRRLIEAQILRDRAGTVADRLKAKNYRNGWGEVIAETMSRRGRG